MGIRLGCLYCPTYLWKILMLNQESTSNPQGSKQDLHFARFPQLPMKVFPVGSFTFNKHPNPIQDPRQHLSLQKAFLAPSNVLTWLFKNISTKGSYFLVSKLVFLLKQLDHMLLCHMPSLHMWLHPSFSGQPAEGFSVLWSPQCHRDGGCRAWTIRTIRRRNWGWDLSEVPYTDEANLPPMASGLHGALLYGKEWRFTFFRNDLTLDVGLSSLPDAPLPTPLSEGWVGHCEFVDTRPMLCCLRPRSRIWAKKVWEWAHDCGIHWLPYTTPLEAVSQNKGVVLQAPQKSQLGGGTLQIHICIEQRADIQCCVSTARVYTDSESRPVYP